MLQVRLLGAFSAISLVLLINSNAAYALVTYDFDGTCQPGWDCGPLGVLTTNVDSVTGTLELNLAESIDTHTWDFADVLGYSFTFGSFTIDDTNSTLSNSLSGTVPFTTTATAPFTPGDGFLLARYNLDNTVFLSIALGGVNLGQGSLTSCSGTCQALATGSWTRTSSVSETPILALFSVGLLGLIIARLRKQS